MSLAIEKREAVQKRRYFGQPLKRMEDPRLVSGQGRYLDDIKLPGMVYASFVRSSYAHALIKKIDKSEALKLPGVLAIFTGGDLADVKDLPTVEESEEAKSTPRPALVIDEARYQGEAIAVVIAKDPYTAEDAAELVQVEYEPLPVVLDVEEAMKPTSPKAHSYVKDNIAYHSVYEAGDIETAFKNADRVITLELVNQRVAPVPLEPRGVLASYDSGSQILTVWVSSQDPHGLRDAIADILGLPQSRVRVIAPDVGGAFGSKISVYPEDVVVCYAAIKLGRPVKWVEKRRENLLTTTHGRGQKQHIEVAVKKDGRILGLKIKIISDSGAYNTPGALDNPTMTTLMAPGVYDIKAYRVEMFSVLTNKVPQDAYRGAGRPEAAYLIERTMNVVARELGLDPVEVRRVNYIKKELFPFKTITGLTYDSADYESNLNKALEVSNYWTLREEQRRARKQGRLVGIGVSTYTEICGFGPSFAQTAAITVTSSGNVIVTIGGHPHGQGHYTPIAQLVADEFGIELERISVRDGDTELLPWSSFTAGSRSAALTGSAAVICARKIKRKMTKIAQKLLGVDGELVFENGYIQAVNDPEKKISFDAVAQAAYQPSKLPEGVEPTLFEYTAFVPPNYLFPYGTHIAVVEVDRETGELKLLKYFAVDDIGRVINPLVVEGQVHGGVAQGVGQALLEEVVYDSNGQLLTSNLGDYLIPTSDVIPEIVWERTETPSDSNPLGVKGVGEAGTIGSTPTIVNAVEDALSPYSVTIDRMPLKAEYIRWLIKNAEERKISST
jgi:carbon-monoxide dehydrogenase large subunit